MSRGIECSTSCLPHAVNTRCAPLRRARWRLLASAALAGLVGLGIVDSASAAQERKGPAPALAIGKKVDPNAQMLLSADQIDYDYDNQTVSAIGNVQIYYDKYTLEADKVIYNQKANRVRAVGNVRMTEPSGNVIKADELDVTDTMREGLVESLRVETADKTRFAAASAERLSEEVTVFRKGVYTACQPCRDNPSKPPLWQVKAARIVYDQREKMIYYKDAQLELFGQPVAYFPFFSHPDPTAGRRSGFLQPSVGYSEDLGVGVSTPYYFNLAPNYDLTITPTYYTIQGLMAQAEWRHRLASGSYMVRGAGIIQQDPEVFGFIDDPKGGPDRIPSPGNRRERGFLRSAGEFQINDFFTWGWDAWLFTDRTFVRNYSLVKPGTTEVVSKAYLTGLSETNYFDVRALDFQTLSASENEDVIPTVHPVMDYSKIFDGPVGGGQLSLNMNFTSLSREEASIREAWGKTYYSGLPGTSNRLSTELEWQRSFIDGVGQVYMPFLSVRGDAFWFDLNDEFVPESLRDDKSFAFRGTPAAGVEYRWPFLSAHDWGTQVIEPIAQLIMRPSEQRIGELPNEDAQSLVYDDTNLFRRDKMSGFDRAEGGVRANVGVSYTIATDGGATANFMFGQSYHLAGANSYDASDEQMAIGSDSGLEDDTADYVGRVLLEPIRNISLVTRFRLDRETFKPERIESGVQFTKGPITASVIYADLQPQVNLGQEVPRQEVVMTTGVRLSERWRLTGSGRYDIERDETRSASLGLIYEDECFSVGISYVGQFYKDEDSDPDNKILVQFNFRTLGGGSFTQSLGTRPEQPQQPVE